jgi:hypothetical protein
MLVFLIVLAYVVVVVCLVVVQCGYYKLPSPYGGGQPRERAVPRRVSDPARDQYADLTKCPPEGPLVFTPEFESTEVAAQAVRYFQTRLSLPREKLLECTSRLEFSAPGAVVGFYVGHLEFFNSVASSTTHESEPFLVDAKPDDVVTLSVRNRGSEPLRITAWKISFERRS